MLLALFPFGLFHEQERWAVPEMLCYSRVDSVTRFDHDVKLW